MRALTLSQPWCGLVASGIKLIENRPRKIIGRAAFGKRFALHASREIDEQVYDRIMTIAPELPTGPLESEWYRLSRIKSAVIAVATLDSDLDVARPSLFGERDLELPPDQRRWFFGPIGYVLRDVITLTTPVPCRGWQGFWTLDKDIQAAVELQLVRILRDRDREVACG